jgi:class 3 adenylate cyclase
MEFLVAKMARPEWTDAATVTTLQEFRDLFSEEMLSPSESFSIRNLSFVFTDLKSSTEMYERLGDSKAFYLVKEHFKIMEEVVSEFDGGVVKTIGDAVMAVFQTAGQALNAARSMVERFEIYNAEHQTQNQIIVKIGIHAGPCIAVTLNDRIDYFGTSVNIAARVQGLSDGRTVMVSDNVFREARPEDSPLWQWERFETSLKGLKDRYTVHKGVLLGS